jgi:hypothetical protein
MKKAIAGAVLSVLSLSLPALAANVERYQVKGQSASAYFSKYDNCGYSSVSVDAFTNRTKEEQGAPTEQMGAYLYYYNNNYCTGTYSSGYGYSPNANFTINNNLNSASLTGTFSVYDYSSGTTKTVDVKVNWTGTDDYSSNSKSSDTYQTPDFLVRSSYKGDSRSAQVSGSAILDGIDLIANTSYSSGTLRSIKSGSYVRTTR